MEYSELGGHLKTLICCCGHTSAEISGFLNGQFNSIQFNVRNPPESAIVKIPKKSNLKICDNWRGIWVFAAISKIISKLILVRLKDHLYSSIDREQISYRPGSSCVDHINTLRLIIDQSAKYRSDLYLVFVDFEKAFDSVDREDLWMALRRTK